MKRLTGSLKAYVAWKVRSLSGYNVLDTYAHGSPSGQATVDILKGEWSSKIPGCESGTHDLFNDKRIRWFETVCGGFKGKKILELGPLEAGHSYMIHKGGAGSILAIEGNARAYLKCLVVKELYKLDNLHVLFGEIVSFLEEDSDRYDTIMALGVLYHMVRPLDLIRHICRTSDQACIWTHYYDEDAIRKNGSSRNFGKDGDLSCEGFRCRAVTHHYRSGLGLRGFCGGYNPFSYWLPKSAIIEAFHHFGMGKHQIEYDEIAHPNGPAFCVLFSR